MSGLKKILIIGSGITGITLAERFASLGFDISIVEKRNNIGGNCYDFIDKNGILIHKYGPHIFHTDYKDVWEYLSQFTKWIKYEHKVLGFIDNKYAPIPFNLNSLNIFFPEKANNLKLKLIESFGSNKKIPILELKKSKDHDLRILSDFIYKKVFLSYTKKQWGFSPEKIDPSVISRVPVSISFDDRYFQDKYQGIPKNGYTKMFEKMINKKKIKIKLKTKYNKKTEKLFDYIFYTGPIDEYFGYKFGKLDYRCFNIKNKTISGESYQESAVVNYPDKKYKFTRVTEYKKLTQQKNKKTIIGFEFPGNKGVIGWPILNNKNLSKLKKYSEESKNFKKIFFVGRLGEFKYYDMDDAVKRSLDLVKFLKLKI